VGETECVRDLAKQTHKMMANLCLSILEFFKIYEEANFHNLAYIFENIELFLNL